MKKIVIFVLIILYFTITCIFLAEKTDVLALEKFPWRTSFIDNTTLTWQRLPYPLYYEIDTYSQNPDSPAVKDKWHFIRRDFCFGNSYSLPPTIYPTYYRIKAHGMFNVMSTSPIIGDPVFTNNPLKPVPISNYTASNPTSLKPYFIWHTVPDAVYYELEILSGKPNNENGIELSKNNHLTSTKRIFTHGYQADLTAYKDNPTLYWRVRAIGAHGESIGVFSDAQQIFVDINKAVVQKPLPDIYDTLPNQEPPLYLVYHWLPMHDVKRYEVEILSHKPPIENDKEASADRLQSIIVDNLFSAYDQHPALKPGTYYWRVRGIDENDNTIGTWSDSQKIVIPQPSARAAKVGVLGDSISHGGGNISYSPANLEYSYETYLDFPTINLSHSGDTSHMTLERFDNDVLPFAPRSLLIMTGDNSLRDSSISAQMIIDDLHGILAKCQKHGIRPVFLTLTPLNPSDIEKVFSSETDPNWRKKMITVNNYIKTLPYHIDLEPYFAADNGNLADKYATDGLHPNLIGKQLMAAIINQHKDLLLNSGN